MTTPPDGDDKMVTTTTVDGKEYTVTVTIAAGEEGGDDTTSLREGDGFVCVYSIDRQDSFDATARHLHR
jgi:hypothetical protein